MAKNGAETLRRRGLKTAGVLAAGALLALGGYWFTSQAGAAVNYDEPELIALGKGLFATNCAVCHGPGAVGENLQSVRGGRKPGGGYWAPALNGTAHAWHHPPDGLFQVIKEGSPAADSPMRGWEDRLSDREIHGLIAYQLSLWPEPLRLRYDKAFLQK